MEDTYTGQENDPLSLNLYTYCENNPIIYDDPTGHKKKAKKEEPKVDYFVDLKLQKTPYIATGSIGAFVLQSEKWLKNIGYNVKIDGIFSKAEASALAQYEAKNKLRPTNGVIDNKTYANLMASNMKEQHKNDVKKRLKTQDELVSYNTYVDNLIKSPQFQNPDYTKDFYTYNYNKLLAHFGGGMEIYNALISLYPGGDAVDIATFAKDLASYKKGDEWKLVEDLVALGIDGVGNFADEFIDSAKKAEKVADVVEEASNSNRVFWSGEDTAKNAAETFAKNNGATTLEMTQQGMELSAKTNNMPWSQAKPLWKEASLEFANGAKGEVNVFQIAEKGVKIESVWATTEYKALILNQNVSKINYNVIMPDGSIKTFSQSLK
jgi:peptidoglycan hydrolase-like protein with peptidoglycan-binding domain